jgi:hypothetical protein
METVKMPTPNEKTTVMLKNVRLGFPALFQPRGFGNETDPEKMTYGCICMIDKESDIGKANIAAMTEAMKVAYNEQWPTGGPKLQPDKLCMKDGDDTDVETNHGHKLVSARNKRRPMVVDRDKTPLQESDGKIYGGMYANVLVRCWAQDSSWGKRINCSLEAVQFVEHGEPFGAPPVSPDVFPDLGGAAAPAGDDANPFG